MIISLSLALPARPSAGLLVSPLQSPAPRLDSKHRVEAPTSRYWPACPPQAGFFVSATFLAGELATLPPPNGARTSLYLPAT